jgi:hypothetical protein
MHVKNPDFKCLRDFIGWGVFIDPLSYRSSDWLASEWKLSNWVSRKPRLYCLGYNYYITIL